MAAKVDIQVVATVDEETMEAVWTTAGEVVPDTGLAVNLIVGQTGTGKTSLIRMMGGGVPTTTSTFADTKHCGLYKVTKAGTDSEYVFMDTVGLLDTASTNEQRKGFIEKMVQFIRASNLNVCRVFFTVPLGGRQMTEMPDWISVLLEALGGEDKLRLVSYWVITKWNQDSAFSKKRCESDKKKTDGTYQTLKGQALGLEVVTHGQENQDELFEIMVPTTSTSKGLSKVGMKPDTEHHLNIVKSVDNLEAGVDDMKKSIDALRTDADFQRQEDMIRRRLAQAASDLANCGKSQAQKQKYKAIIDAASEELRNSATTWRGTKASKEEKTRKLQELSANFECQLKDLRKREGLMVKLTDLVGVKASEAKEVLNLRGGYEVNA